MDWEKYDRQQVEWQIEERLVSDPPSETFRKVWTLTLFIFMFLAIPVGFIGAFVFGVNTLMLIWLAGPIVVFGGMLMISIEKALWRRAMRKRLRDQEFS